LATLSQLSACGHDMFYIIKTIEAFILPPGFLIIILIGAGIWHVVRGQRFLSLLLCAAGLIAWALSISPVSDILMKHVESELDIPNRLSGDVIIVLGAGIHVTMPDIEGSGSPTLTTFRRLYAAAQLHKRLNLPVLFSGAGNRFKPASVDSIVIRTLGNMGVPSKSILIEAASKNTRENAANSASICNRHGFSNPILVSSGYHLKRSTYYFNKEGLSVTPFAAGFETWEGKSYSFVSFLPRSFEGFSIAMKEVLALFITRLVE